MPGVFGALIPLAAISGWIIVAVVRMISRTRIRELEIRERIAMIERGLVPPPEKDPGGFERAMDRRDRGRRPSGRHQRAGIILIGVGFGLMMLIGMTDEVRHGIGVGGFLVLLGLAFVISNLLDGSAQAGAGEFQPPPPASAPNTQPPTT